MNPYSHIVVASKLESMVKPENAQEYYWGAIAPDIRYPARIRRHQTHIPPERIAGFLLQYPHRKSFLQGYLIHCLADEIELRQVFIQHFPFSILKRMMYRHPTGIILEMYYFEHERVNQRLSGSYNEVLSELGVSETISARYSHSMSQYLVSQPLESRLLELFRLLGRENHRRKDTYISAANLFQKNWLLRNFFFFGISHGKISEQIVSGVTTLYQQFGL